MKSKVKNFFIIVCGVAYGFISLYWLSLGIAMAFNIFGDDNGRYEEYEFLQPYGWMLLVFFAIVLAVTAYALKRKGKLIRFFGGWAVGVIFAYVLAKILG